MRIDAVLRQKGQAVASIRPEASVREALAELARHGIGALVVSSDGRTPAGMMSERDVVRAVDRSGADVLDSPVSSIMSTELQTCSPEDEVETLMAIMTRYRIRHVPVLKDGELAGIVSIGDVVKNRMDELEEDRKALVDFIYAR
ncbi:MAG TPA: CBS domain-containing protein [Acidimicrobiales bacterium]|nr:CBS domain-containing protein [Acidimicrobiales bacterium]